MAINTCVLTVLATATVVFGLAGQSQVQAAPNLSVLWAFGGLEANDGTTLDAPLRADDHGNLYGTTAGGGDKGASSRGTVFELTPPAPGQTQWSEKILWTFLGPDGAAPAGGLIADARGNLYGTTETGGANGNNGTVFELTPPEPQQTQWSEQVLWSFSGGSDGGIPFAGLIMDRRGNLYGTTAAGGLGYGVIFELTPPARGKTQWSESVLWSFSGGSDGNDPAAGLLMDRDGKLYGTTAFGGNGCGVVFELTPPRGGRQWSERVLWSFTCGLDGAKPLASLIMDRRGNLYGTTSVGGMFSNGVAFQLLPPAHGGFKWTERVLWSFSGGSDGSAPVANLLMDDKGNLYGTTFLGGAVYDDGTAFELMPPARGGTQWSERVLWALADSRDGAEPKAGLIADAKGNLYGTASIEGPNGGGTAFKITP